MGEKHRIVNKSFETELWIDGNRIALNHMMQETLANVLVGFSKTLKGTDADPNMIDVKIKKLLKSKKVDAHTYP